MKESLPDEPLCFCLHRRRLVAEFLNAGMDDVRTSSHLLVQLPPANYNSLVLLLDCAKRVSEQSAANGMTTRQIAEELAPCLLWHPLPSDVAKVPLPPPGSYLRRLDKFWPADPSLPGSAFARLSR